MNTPTIDELKAFAAKIGTTGGYLILRRWPREAPHPTDPWEIAAWCPDWKMARGTYQALVMERQNCDPGVRCLFGDFCLAVTGRVYQGGQVDVGPDWRVIHYQGCFEHDVSLPR